jgi:hypothetical protein
MSSILYPFSEICCRELKLQVDPMWEVLGVVVFIGTFPSIFFPNGLEHHDNLILCILC